MKTTNNSRFKRAVKSALIKSRLARASCNVLAPCAAILQYHSVLPKEHPIRTTTRGLSYDTSVFEAQMRYLAEHYCPVTLDEIVSSLQADEALPRRAVAVTFDDGFRDNLEFAMPILDRYDIKGTFYVMAGQVGKSDPPWFCRVRKAFELTTVKSYGSDLMRWDLTNKDDRFRAIEDACKTCATKVGKQLDKAVQKIDRTLGVDTTNNVDVCFLTWPELNELHQSGHLIGSHTLTHPNVAHISTKNALSELKQSKQILEEKLGAEIRHFAYPHPVACLSPNFNSETNDLVRQAGYLSAITCLRGPVRKGHNVFALPRITAPRNLLDFRFTLETICFR